MVPTRNESGNIVELLSRTETVLSSFDSEVIFVDDSDDQTPSVIEAASRKFNIPVRMLHRAPGERIRGLGGAVVEGFKVARAPWVVVIDGDLQHPPELIPQIMQAAKISGVDLVTATRYHKDGEADGLNGWGRMWVSALCTLLVKFMFPRRLRGVSDPMSGFFAVRVNALHLPTLRPPGYKVLLEIAVRTPLPGKEQVPYTFQERFSGQSKASVTQGLTFLRHVLILRFETATMAFRRLAGFLGIGLSGAVVNTLVLWTLTSSLPTVPYPAASLIATQFAIVWNFLLLELTVFSAARTRSVGEAFGRFWLLNTMLIPVQFVLLAFCVELLGLPIITANVVTLAVVFGFRYVLCTDWVYRQVEEHNFAAAPAWPSDPTSDAPTAPPAMALVTAGEGAARRRGLYVGRLALPVLLTVLAFPDSVSNVLRSPSGSMPRLDVVAIGAAAILIVAARSTPRPNEPDVHDRQLDVVLALPFLAGSVWLSYSWAAHFSMNTPMGNRGAIAVTCFLIGSSIILLGTRMTARLRLALCVPLLGMPAVADRPLLEGGLLAILLGLATVWAVEHVRAAKGQNTFWPGMAPLPHVRMGGVFITIVACGLGFAAI